MNSLGLGEGSASNSAPHVFSTNGDVPPVPIVKLMRGRLATNLVLHPQLRRKSDPSVSTRSMSMSDDASPLSSELTPTSSSDTSSSSSHSSRELDSLACANRSAMRARLHTLRLGVSAIVSCSLLDDPAPDLARFAMSKRQVLRYRHRTPRQGDSFFGQPLGGGDFLDEQEYETESIGETSDGSCNSRMFSTPRAVDRQSRTSFEHLSSGADSSGMEFLRHHCHARCHRCQYYHSPCGGHTAASNRGATPDVSLCHASDSESSTSAAGPDRLNAVNDMAVAHASVADDSNVSQLCRLVVDDKTLGQEKLPSLTVTTMEPMDYSRKLHRYNHHTDGSGADSIGLSSSRSSRSGGSEFCGSEFSLGEAEPQHPRGEWDALRHIRHPRRRRRSADLLQQTLPTVLGMNRNADLAQEAEESSLQ